MYSKIGVAVSLLASLSIGTFGFSLIEQLSPYAGYRIVRPSASQLNSVEFGALVWTQIDREFGAEFRIGSFLASEDSENADIIPMSISTGAALTYQFHYELAGFSPYVLGGMEYTAGAKGTMGIRYGIGVNSSISRNWPIKFLYERISVSDGTDQRFSIRFDHLLSGGKSAHSTYENYEDSDLDGVPDFIDEEPNSPPNARVDQVGRTFDSDFDGINDVNDHCPGTPYGMVVDGNGCPPDQDSDGVADVLDQCNNTPFEVSVDEMGCPIDKDNDGIADYLDHCPNTPDYGIVNPSGCMVAINVDIKFPINKATIQQKYYGVIKEVADFMKKYPNLDVELQGHTDDSGSPKFNKALSLKRAKAVRNVLVNTYRINSKRVSYKGFGYSKPLVPNIEEISREINRRVEARIIFKGLEGIAQ